MSTKVGAVVLISDKIYVKTGSITRASKDNEKRVNHQENAH